MSLESKRLGGGRGGKHRPSFRLFEPLRLTPWFPKHPFGAILGCKKSGAETLARGLIAKSKIASQWEHGFVGHSCHYRRCFQQLTAEDHTFRGVSTHPDRFITDDKGLKLILALQQAAVWKTKEPSLLWVNEWWTQWAMLQMNTDTVSWMSYITHLPYWGNGEQRKWDSLHNSLCKPMFGFSLPLLL